LKFGFNSGSGHEPRVAFLAEAWRQAFGLETEQIGSDFSVFLQQRHAGVYALSRNGWNADYPHANNQLGLFVCGGGNNDTQFCNTEFDRLITEAAAEPDQDKQVALYQQAQTIMYEDAANLPLRFGLITYEIQPYVGGIQVGITDAQLPGDALYETMYIKKH
jgi:oligopeptide transport system substrate-binding protein